VDGDPDCRRRCARSTDDFKLDFFPRAPIHAQVRSAAGLCCVQAVSAASLLCLAGASENLASTSFVAAGPYSALSAIAMPPCATLFPVCRPVSGTQLRSGTMDIQNGAESVLSLAHVSCSRNDLSLLSPGWFRSGQGYYATSEDHVSKLWSAPTTLSS
jgi:hypothetical protein